MLSGRPPLDPRPAGATSHHSAGGPCLFQGAQDSAAGRNTGRVWFSLELAKKHPHSLEYVVVREMSHLLERNHGEGFTKLMDSLMADWRCRRDALNAARLADDAWLSQDVAVRVDEST